MLPNLATMGFIVNNNIYMSHRKHVYVFVPPNSDETKPIIRYLLERYLPLPTDSMKTFYERLENQRKNK